MAEFDILLGILIIGYVLAVILFTLFEEGYAWCQSWWERGPTLTGARQPYAVRQCAKLLTSSRRADRLKAARLLGDINNRTATPALLGALERYYDDAPFLEVVVHSLTQLGDPRALPALRRLTTGRNQSLMQAAREAIAAIEPKAVLLRPGAQPIAEPDTLLRAASPQTSPATAEVLLRGAERP